VRLPLVAHDLGQSRALWPANQTLLSARGALASHTVSQKACLQQLGSASWR
jgi:hypothetical protein